MDGRDNGQVPGPARKRTLPPSRRSHNPRPRDAGTQAIICGADSLDEGQDALVAAEGTPFDYNFRLTLNDPATLNGHGTILYYSGKVMSKRRNVGNVSNVVKYTFNIGINTAILEVAPT